MKTQIHLLHIYRIFLFMLLVGAVGLVQANPHTLPRLSYSADSSVLAYATSISRNDLLQAANESRAANGLAPLSLNSSLNSSAQMKAQHMVDNNYWAHVAPDGTQPWYFFEIAGYNYSAAGENLAYGFATSYDTNQGWMNSDTHRANILGNYKEVGFGFVNGASFQGSENTVVVAHYGTAQSPPPPAPKPEPAPTPEAEPAPEVTEPVVESINDQPPANEPEKAEPKEEGQEEETKEAALTEDTVVPPPIVTGTTTSVPVWQTMLRGSLPTMAMISLGVVAVSAIGYSLTHRSLVKHVVVSGEQFALHHPAFDAMAVATAVALILMTTVAQLQ